MPRVLFIHHRPQLSGAARSLALLASGLDESWDLHAVAPDGPAAEAFRRAGVTVHSAPVPAFTHTWDVQYHGARWLVLGLELGRLPAHVRRLRAVLRELRPDLVHINDGVMLASGAVAARSGAPVVWHLRSSLANGGRDHRSRWVCAALDRSGTAAVAIDEDVAATFRLELPLHVIPNPAPLPGCVSAELDVPAGRVTLGSFGFLRRQKGWPELLAAVRLLLDAGCHVHAVFVGGTIRPTSAFRGLHGRLLRAVGVPDEQGDFDAAVAALGLDGHVTVIPHVVDPLPYMRAVDVVVFPNQGTGLGRSVLEAAALGKPVVASGSSTGAGLIIPGTTGLLVDERGAAPLARVLQRVVSDPALRARLGEAAAAGAETRTPSLVASEVARLWRDVIETSRTTARPAALAR